MLRTCNIYINSPLISSRAPPLNNTYDFMPIRTPSSDDSSVPVILNLFWVRIGWWGKISRRICRLCLGCNAHILSVILVVIKIIVLLIKMWGELLLHEILIKIHLLLLWKLAHVLIHLLLHLLEISHKKLVGIILNIQISIIILWQICILLLLLRIRLKLLILIYLLILLVPTPLLL